MRLTPDQHRDVARRACWYCDCYFGSLTQDNVVFTGDGVDDLDRLKSRLLDNASQNPSRSQRFLVDIGAQYSDWRPFDLDDVDAIRSAYVDFFGEVPKPDVYAPGTGTALASA